MTKTVAIIAFAAYMSGCASLTIGPTVEHLSHATQHRPFTENPTRYGAELVGITASARIGAHVRVDLFEGASLDKHYAQTPSYGEIIGPREQFEGRITYEFHPFR